MKKSILIYVYYIVFAVLGSYGALHASLGHECDISDYVLRPLLEESLYMWSLLDLAENKTIVDHALFYDQLCQAALRLCSETQQIYEHRHIISMAKIEEQMHVCSLLHTKFTLLPAPVPGHPASGVPDGGEKNYHHAIDIILRYAHHFLKNNMGIYADSAAS